MLSSSEKAIYRSSFSNQIRLDGRGLEERRESVLSCGTLRNASGSASITLGNATDVLVAIQAKVNESPSPLHFFINYAPSILVFSEQTLRKSALLQELLSSAYSHYTQFPIEGTDRFWLLNADIMVLNDSGNVFEAVFGCVAAALGSTRLPAAIDPSGGIFREDLIPLEITTYPTLKYVVISEQNVITDPTLEEEYVSDTQLFLIREADSHYYVRKTGTGLLSTEQFATMLSAK